MGSLVSYKHILVVDDEPFNREIILEILDDPGYRLSVAEDGDEAWTRLSQAGETFDLVLLDRMMPGIDGLEILRRMKAAPALRDLPVIMQTAAASPEQVREGIAAGPSTISPSPSNSKPCRLSYARRSRARAGDARCRSNFAAMPTLLRWSSMRASSSVRSMRRRRWPR